MNNSVVELNRFDVLRISLDDYRVSVVDSAIGRDHALARELLHSLRDRKLRVFYVTAESGMLKDGDSWMDEVGYLPGGEE